MELKCPGCGEKAVHGRPNDAGPQVPPDRAQYRHTDGSQLCPTVGIDATGRSGYVPSLPIDRRL